MYQDVIQHEPTVKHILKTSQDILKDKKPGPERDVLEKATDELQRRWNYVNDKVRQRHQQIQRIMPQAHVYSNEVDHFEPWLEDAEKQVKALPVISSNPEDLTQRKRDLEVMRSRIFIYLFQYLLYFLII